MKNIVRAFVVVLALTGAVATTQTSSSKTTITASKVSAIPTPTCPPNSPNACNIRAGW